MTVGYVFLRNLIKLFFCLSKIVLYPYTGLVVINVHFLAHYNFLSSSDLASSALTIGRPAGRLVGAWMGRPAAAAAAAATCSQLTD